MIPLLLVLVFSLVVYIAPIGLLVALPVWGATRLRRRGNSWVISLLPMLIPFATWASEVYPKWLIRNIVQKPIGEMARPEKVKSIYAFNGYAPDAVRLLVQFPSLEFAEGVIDETRRGDQSVFNWDRMPTGYVRFSGRRIVQKAADCRDNEVSVPDTDSAYPYKVTWNCTEWTPVNQVGATHEVKFSFQAYSIGPYHVLERRDFVIRRSGKLPVNTLISVSISGGIWWNVTEWFGDVTGVSALGNGNTLGPYGASTAQYLSGTGEEFLMTGRR